MGWYKWLAVALVAIPVVLATPYALNSGGKKNGLASSSAAVLLAGCPMRYKAAMKDELVSLTAAVDPQCAPQVRRPEMLVLGPGGDILARAPMRGVSAALRAKLLLAPEATQLALGYGQSATAGQTCLATVTNRNIVKQPCT